MKAVVTGGAGALGRGIGQALAGSCWDVAVSAVDDARGARYDAADVDRAGRLT